MSAASNPLLGLTVNQYYSPQPCDIERDAGQQLRCTRAPSADEWAYIRRELRSYLLSIAASSKATASRLTRTRSNERSAVRGGGPLGFWRPRLAGLAIAQNLLPHDHRHGDGEQRDPGRQHRDPNGRPVHAQ